MREPFNPRPDGDRNLPLVATTFADHRRTVASRMDRARRRLRARLVREPRRAQVAASRRRPLRGNRTRDARNWRLRDATAQRPRVLREAAATVLAHRAELQGIRA